jgi:hypothetical protein
MEVIMLRLCITTAIILSMIFVFITPIVSAETPYTEDEQIKNSFDRENIREVFGGKLMQGITIK